MAMCRAVIQEVKTAGGTAILWSEFLRYDETPMRTRLVDPELLQQSTSTTIALGASSSSTQVVSVTCQATHVAKILQTQRQYAMLFHIPGKGHVQIRFETPCWLQSLSRTTGEAYWAALELSELEGEPELAEQFARAERIVCTDAAGGCTRYERVHEASSGRPALRVTCEVHMVAKWFESVFDPMSAHTRKLHEVAKALRAGDAMRTFRKTLREFVSSNLDFRPQSRPSDIVARQNIAMLDLFLPARNRTARIRRAAILALANGDWRRQGVVEHHCLGCCRSREECALKLSTIFVACVASCAPPTWPESRWTGFDLALEWQGLLDSIHGLLSHCFAEWCAALQRGEAHTSSHERTHQPPATLMLDDIAGGWCGRANAARLEEEEAPAGEGREASASESKVGQKDAARQHGEASKLRSSARQWLETPRLPVFVLLRRVVEPLVTIMASYLECAGEDFEQRMVTEAARQGGTVSTDDLLTNLEERHLLAAFRGTFEQRCLDAARGLLLEGSSWAVLPEFARTSIVRTRAFIMLSSIGCHCWEMMTFHTGYPFCLFEVVVDPSAAENMDTKVCEHRMDKWSKEFLEHHRAQPGGLGSETARAELLHTLLVARRETCQIEAQHASVRRALLSNSVQTHALMLKHVSAHMTTQKARKVTRLLRRRLGVAPPKSKRSGWSARAKGGQKPQPRGRHGGAWRAYIREQTAFVRGSPDFAKLAEQYRALPEEDRQRLQAVGRQATKNAGQGDPLPFGEPPVQARRRAAKRQRDEAFAEAAAAPPRGSVLDSELALTSRAPMLGEAGTSFEEDSPGVRLQALRREFRMEAGAKALAQRKSDEALLEYYDKGGAELLGTLSQAQGGGARFRLEACSNRPGSGGTSEHATGRAEARCG